jgi:hypothetical protein
VSPARAASQILSLATSTLIPFGVTLEGLSHSSSRTGQSLSSSLWKWQHLVQDTQIWPMGTIPVLWL